MHDTAGATPVVPKKLRFEQVGNSLLSIEQKSLEGVKVRQVTALEQDASWLHAQPLGPLAQEAAASMKESNSSSSRSFFVHAQPCQRRQHKVAHQRGPPL